MKSKFTWLSYLLWGMAWMSNSCSSDEVPQPIDNTYFPKVKGIIQASCLSCHSSSGDWAGRPVAFDSDSSISMQASSIKSAVADPITSYNKRMPQGGTLSANEIATIVNWYNKGGGLTD